MNRKAPAAQNETPAGWGQAGPRPSSRVLPPPTRVAVVGSGGQLGRALLDAFGGVDVVGLSRAECDLTDRDAVARAVASLRPQLVVNAAAYTDVNRAELEPEAAFAVNAEGARWVAQAAQQVGAGVVYVSTDYVFDGEGGAPYHELSEPRPLSVYGRSKLAGERETQRFADRAWVVRTSWLYGGPNKTFVNAIIGAAQTHSTLDVVQDEVGGPTLATDLAHGIRTLVGCAPPGTYHLANAGECSRAEFARAILELVGSATSVRPVASRDYWAGKTGVAPRPAHSTLANTAAAAMGVRLRPWRDGLVDHLRARR